MSPINPLSPTPLPLRFNPKSNLSPSFGKAQNFSVSKLNYQKDITNAKVSMNQINSKRTGAVSSVSHLVGQNTVAT